MITDERITSYIHSLAGNDSSICMQIEREALADNVPIIRKEMGCFLKAILASKHPKNILEVGAAVGYSSILMSENIDSDARITTIENYDKRIAKAKENIRRAGKENVITLLEGDAGEILKSLSGSYDFIFMDAAKAQYIVILPEIMRLLASGGILITDNVLQEGDLVQSRFAVCRRDRTIHSRMREYLYAVTHSDELVTSVIPLGDGITFSVKK